MTKYFLQTQRILLSRRLTIYHLWDNFLQITTTIRCVYDKNVQNFVKIPLIKLAYVSLRVSYIRTRVCIVFPVFNASNGVLGERWKSGQPSGAGRILRCFFLAVGSADSYTHASANPRWISGTGYIARFTRVYLAERLQQVLERGELRLRLAVERRK